QNVAKGGKATQSSVGSGGGPERGIDGNKDPECGRVGIMHTKENEANPWWEVDLGAAHEVDTVAVWSRQGFADRLDGFTLKLLDENRKEVFTAVNVAAPESMVIDVKNGGKQTYLTFNGKPGKSAPKKPGAANAPELVAVPADYKDLLPFAFGKRETVAILGNGLPDRMQHDGWMETLLQSALPEQNVRFRNMSASGDRPGHFPRSSGHMHMTDYLRHVKPDVVFAFFGYNESFENKPEAYQKQLVDFVKYVRGTKANGKAFPRVVLFSPIAHEDTKNPNVPDGKAHNPLLEAYTQATEAAAKEAGVAFVDLFHPSLALFQSAKEPLTINGVHLTAEGDRQLAEVIAKALLGRQVSSSPSMEELRAAVLDKDLHWNARYRARDGNDVWGSRSTLAFSNKQTNGEVLQHELTMLDVMTANRDEQVWARANGKDKKIDDSSVPKPVPVISNVGGGSSSSSAVKEGRLEYVSGQQAIQQMAFDPRFEVGLFADEAKFPQLVNPVQLQVDTKGRLWAAAWHTYPMWEPLKEMKDALLICHDDDHDGKCDRVTEFARVQNPLGFEFWNGGVIVTCAPDIIFLKDTDGDDVADVRQILVQGVDFADTHHGANNLIMGPDGGIYWQSGVFMQHNYEHPWGPSLEAGASAMYRFDPRRFTIAMHALNSPNPHGIAFDNWGYQYATDGTGGRAYQVRPEGNGFKMYELLKKEVRPVTASEVVSSTNFPDDMQGDFLICNVIGFLGIKHYDLARNGETGAVWGEPAGAELTVKSVQADGTTTEDKSRGLLMSGDKNFRPSDAIFGEDGALYIADWHNVIIGHMQHNVRDPNRDHKHGRIYRMTAKGRPLQKPVAIDGQPIPALLENLKHPTDGVRQRTRVELSERPTADVVSATREWIKQFDPAKKEDAHHLLEALWVFQQHNVRNTELLAALQKSPEPHARNAAHVVQQLWFNVEASTKGGIIAGEVEKKAEKSGILSDTPELTTIRVGTVPERLIYDVKELTVKSGKKIKLTFANTDVMPHNLLILKPGKADAIMTAAMVMGAKGFENGFMPDGGDVLWHTKLLDNGKQEVLEFTAPAKGAYPYICSFPGHGILMRGVLKVE
ncbi:MAG TPA: PVC-type heme-binding CxxCH protein, partial [Verrucomicrobium sp.]|nr:PVC-type heme-binding CxxCH protein [Verrucomicrobium sp.]